VGVADPASATTSATGDQVVADARRYLGVPYVWGGTDPQQGLDCSGLVQRVYADLGVDLPRVAADQARQGTPVASLAQARPGDLLAFGDPVDHIGIYAGNGQMVVAPKSGDVVKVEAVYRTPTAIRRILPDAATAATTPTAYAGSATGALAAAPAAYRDLFTAAAARHGVPAGLLASVARAESGFNASAVSHAGALGLMQLMPGTARSLGVNPLDPGQAVDGAARLLAQDLRTFGSTELALAAYNAGPDAVRRYGGVPPYAETRAYVQRVLAYQNGGAA
jgi:soluble lytic murein transglycosylase-like protein